MLTEQAAVTETVGLDNVPIGFITTDDGRTLLAVTENEDGMLELMTTPVTLVQQNNVVSPSLIKTVDGSLILQPSIFQISLDGIVGTGIQQTSVLPVQTLQSEPVISNRIHAIQSKDVDLDVVTSMLSVENSVSDIEKDIPDKKTETKMVVEKKRSPGRPRKDGSSSQNLPTLKCDICGQSFNKQTLYRKHMDHHAEEKPHRCPKCPASFNIPSNFTLHMATHNIGEPKCPECGRKFARMASLKSHMLLHEKEENLFCTECEDAFATKAQLDAHLKLHGEKWATEDVRKCKLCNKQFVQPALYRLHIREHYRLQTKIVKQTKRGTKHKTMYKCTICLKFFQKPSQLMRHIRVHTGEKPFKCTICSRAFTQKGSLQIHMWQHNGIRPHSCNFCNAKFGQKGNLNAHILRVHNAREGEAIYRCTYCSCIFKKLGSLNGHIKRMHSNPEEETTQKCDSSTEADMQATVNNVISQLASLESGVSNSTDSVSPVPVAMTKNDILQQALKNSGLPSKNKNPSSAESSESKKGETRTTYVTLLDRAPDGTMRKYLTIKQRCVGNVRWYSCSFCHKEFKKPSDLIRHLRVHTQEKPFKCCFCFRSFALKSTMIAHERTHTGATYTCGSCDKTFSCHNSLAAHVRLHVKHRCNECNKHFSSAAVLTSHMKNHEKEKSKISQEAEELVPQIVLQEPLVISDAGNKISVAHIQSKQNHVYNNTDTARPHKCWVCHAAFRKISHLKQHYRRHTGERPYKCTKCDRRFSSNSVLKSHLHTHEDTRPYSCSVCNTKFSTQSSMKRHLVTHSNKRPFMCPYCHKTFKTSVNCRKHMKIHKHELAQRQLEQQKSNEQTTPKGVENKITVAPLPENLTLAEDMEVSFQPQMAPDFTQAFSDQFQNITEQKEKSYLANSDTTQPVIVNHDIVDTTNVGSSQTLHADETGTITLPNYSGDQTLTSESIRELEETLNQQLFNIGVNLGLGSNLPRQVDDPNVTSMETRDQPVLNIIYENSKNLETNNPIFPTQFDSFDMGQITLQPDAEIDIGINSTNSTSMASILPRSAQEELRLNSVTAAVSADENPIKSNRHLIAMDSKQNCIDALKPVPIAQKQSKVIAKADTTNNSEHRNVHSTPKEHKTLATCESDIVPLPFDERFQNSTDLHTQAKSPQMLKATNPNEVINITKCTSLLQCHMCGKQGFTTSGLKEHLKTHGGTKEYQCTECSLKFCTNGGLSRHLKMHMSKQQWRCPICQKCLNSKVQLKAHSKIHNTGSVEPDSSQKESSIPLNTNLSAIPAIDIKIGTDPSVSEKVLLDTVAEKEIMERLGPSLEHKEKKEYTNKCKYCPKTFRKPSDLIRHIRTHTGERPYKCDYCNKSFAVKCTLDSHVKVHIGKKTFCCHVCNSLFATKGSLKVHMRLHTGSKPFKCPMCDLRFRTSGHRKVHLLKHIREHKGTAKRKTKHAKVSTIAEVASNLEKTIQNAAQTTAIDEEVPPSIEYPSIDTITIDTNALTNQLTFNTDGTILNNNSVLSINESNQLVANLHFLLANGLVTIQTDDSLQVPNLPNSEPNLIQENNRITEFLQPTSMPCSEANGNHIVIATQIPTQLNCSTNQADLQFENKYQADSKSSVDMKRASNGLSMSNNETDDNHILIATPLSSDLNIPTDQGVQLNNCMTVMQLGNLNPTNIKTEPGVKKQAKYSQSKKECDICGKTFMKPYQVERHKRIHTGERPYKCDLCTKSFAQKSTLQMHQKHHTGDRPYPCPHCEYSFTQKGNLQTHLKRVHQLDTLENKKLRKSQQVLSAKLNQDSLDDTKILNLDDISFVELLK